MHETLGRDGLGEDGGMTLLAINGSHSASSSTHNVAALAVELHGAGEVVDLVTLDPAGLIGTQPSEDVAAVLGAIDAASILVLTTPIYRATYSGLLKVLFDQLPAGGLRDKATVLAATAGSPAHLLALDTGMRALVASLEGWTVPTVTYATPADFDETKRPSDAIRASLGSALGEAAKLLS
jgi:FMN reductase